MDDRRSDYADESENATILRNVYKPGGEAEKRNEKMTRSDDHCAKATHRRRCKWGRGRFCRMAASAMQLYHSRD